MPAAVSSSVRGLSLCVVAQALTDIMFYLYVCGVVDCRYLNQGNSHACTCGCPGKCSSIAAAGQPPAQPTWHEVH
jgi:hypothetical protein